MNDKMNDCFEILIIIAHVSLDIHGLVRKRTDSWIQHALVLIKSLVSQEKKNSF